MNEAEQSQVAEVVREFGERLRDERWNEVALTLRISGGMPSQRRHEEFELKGNGSVLGRYSDAVSATAMREESLTFAEAETHELFRRAAAGIAKLVEQPHLRFLPDSLVGSITVGVKGRHATLYFVPEEARSGESRRLPRELTQSLDRLRTAFKRRRSEGEQR